MRPLPLTRRSATAALGGALGVAVLAAISAAWPGAGGGITLVLAPLGASAVLVFAVPASPLAQPWPVLGGNVLSAAIGVACQQLLHGRTLAAAVAVGAAILVMSAARCLHPPGGAVALIAVVGPPGLHGTGFHFVLTPVAFGSALLVLVALAYNNATGHRYPHRAPARPAHAGHGTTDPAPQQRVGFTEGDIAAALARYGDLLDVSRDDLDALFREVEATAGRHLAGGIACSALMSRDLVACPLDAGVERARTLLREHRLVALPVLGPDGVPVGTVDAADLLDPAVASLAAVVRPAVIVAPATPAGVLLRTLSTGETREALVVGPDGRLAGVVTQTDLLAALYRVRIAEAAQP